MIKPSTITQWLMQPAKFSDKDRKDAAALIKTYPYFVPTRYVEASEHQKKQPFAPAMLNMMHLYMGNWLLFNEFLNTATGNHSVPVISQPEEAIEEDLLPDEELINDFTEEDFASFDQPRKEEVVTTTDPLPSLENTEEIIEEEPFSLSNLEAKEEEQEVISEAPPKEPLQEAAQAVPEARQPVQEVPEQKIPEPTTEVEETIEQKIPPVAVTNKQPAPAAPVMPVKEEVNEVSREKDVTAADNKPPVIKKERPKEKPIDQIPFYQNRKEDSLIQPIYTEDYFLHQGLHVSDKLPPNHPKQSDKSLMVVMSFSEWLLHFKTKGEREKEEQEDQKALKTMWQKEKLAAALEEENEEIPETVFEMAVNSIAKEEDLASEPLAEIMVKQGKHEKAIEMYRKLSLRNPQKKTYFARKIDELQKEKES